MTRERDPQGSTTPHDGRRTPQALRRPVRTQGALCPVINGFHPWLPSFVPPGRGPASRLAVPKARLRQTCRLAVPEARGKVARDKVPGSTSEYPLRPGGTPELSQHSHGLRTARSAHLLHPSTPPLLHYSTTPLLHYSTTPPLHYSSTPSLPLMPAWCVRGRRRWHPRRRRCSLPNSDPVVGEEGMAGGLDPGHVAAHAAGARIDGARLLLRR